jgi:hypothetical protein
MKRVFWIHSARDPVYLHIDVTRHSVSDLFNSVFSLDYTHGTLGTFQQPQVPPGATQSQDCSIILAVAISGPARTRSPTSLPGQIRGNFSNEEVVH